MARYLRLTYAKAQLDEILHMNNEGSNTKMQNEIVQKDMSLNDEIIAKYNTHPETLGGKKRLNLTRSYELLEEAKNYLPGVWLPFH